MPSVWSDPVFVRAFFKRAAQVLGGLVLMAVFFFVSAGGMDFPRAWLSLGIYLAHVLVNLTVFLKYAPEIVAKRSEIHLTKTWDKIFAVLYTLDIFAIFAVAGLDVGRFHWSFLGPEWVLPGAILFALGAALVTWSMISNKIFECAARVTKSQTTVTQGPYAFIRHPGYAGMTLYYGAAPLIIGSAWALVPVAIIALLMASRTKMEDEMLQKELTGYKEYARKVKWRLVPGVW